MNRGEAYGMWDEEDGFYYDLLRLPDGTAHRLKVRSLVGLLPLCAATVFEGELIERYPWLLDGVRLFIERFSDTLANFAHAAEPNPEGKRLLALDAALLADLELVETRDPRRLVGSRSGQPRRRPDVDQRPVLPLQDAPGFELRGRARLRLCRLHH